MKLLLNSPIAALVAIDFYKADHRRQYPELTEGVYSNFTPRSVHWLPKIDGTDDLVVATGIQYTMMFIEELFETFFDSPKEEVMRLYKRRLDNALGKDMVPIEHIGDLHNLGYLPLSVRALPEGTCVKAGIPVFTIENTLPKFFWLTNYLETVLSFSTWKTMTSATLARKYRKLLTDYAIATGAPVEFVNFQGHDFSFRGMSGMQDGVLSGFGHLTSFTGTDTVAAIDFSEHYYGANSDKELIGASVPATEHSVMCMGGDDNETETFRRLIEDIYPSGIVSIVSDTWDFWSVISVMIPELKDKIVSRDGRVVIRPDSGDPVKIVCGDPDAPEGSLEFKGAVECLWETFGGTETEKGFKALDSHIGLIYGDSITLPRAVAILEGLKAKGFASSNIVFGIGSFTYEYQTRDTLGLAMKATAGVVDGEVREIFKSPKTDKGGLKKSARGYLVVKDGVLINQASREEMETQGDLKEIYRDGEFLVKTTLSEIRTRIQSSLE